ncbi:histone-like nucleoid-structuring protein, MvaT/MvaU family [Carnimonas nigrificans]|uniref:histone-like nucleoid-structuring protein, MvaT/MvaU family n=1 Tax=Carnimonas nigrificans TaxID=64323 RepID=UPI000470D8D5|nr:histone-like nucleoid-structuring protein, MvaT/MvaU family [Carnimonas nigrificans]
MAVLSDYLKMEKELEELQARLKAMESNDSFKNELEFKNKLEALLEQYGKKASDVIDILDPQGNLNRGAKSTSNSGQGTRRKRKLKVYKNPHTGDVIETRGGNHKELKAWKEEHGSETVEGWLVDEQ